MPIKKWITIFIIIAAFISMLFLLMTQSYLVQLQDMNSTEVELGVSRDLSLMIDWLDRRIEHFEQVVRLFSSQALDEEHIHTALDHLQEFDPYFSALYFTDISGKNYISGGHSVRIDGRERPWYREAIHQKIYISDVYIDILTKEKVLTISQAIFNSDNEMQGVLGVDLKIEEIKSAMGGEVFIVNPEDFAHPYTMTSRKEGYRVALRPKEEEPLILPARAYKLIAFDIFLFVVLGALWVQWSDGDRGDLYLWEKKGRKTCEDLIRNETKQLVQLEIEEETLFDDLEEGANHVQLISKKIQFIEQANHQEMRFFSEVIDRLPDYLWVVDERGQGIYANRNFKFFLQAPSGEWNINDYCPQLKENSDDRLNVFLRRDHEDLLMSFVHPQTRERVTVNTKTKCRSIAGGKFEIHGISKDVTREKILADRYSESHRELSMLREWMRVLNGSDLDEVIAEMTSKMMALLPIEGVTIRLDDGQGHLHLAGHSLNRFDLLYDEEHVKGTHLAAAFERNEILIIENESDMLFEEPAIAEALHQGKSWCYFPLEAGDRVLGVLSLLNSGKWKKRLSSMMEINAQNIAVVVEKIMMQRQLKNHFILTIESLAQSLEKKSKTREGRSKRIAQIARRIAEILNLKKAEIENLYLAGLLHQVGKFRWSEEDLRQQDEKKAIQDSVEMAEEIGLSREVCEAIERQDQIRTSKNHQQPPSFDGNIICIAIDFDQLLMEGNSPSEAFKSLKEQRYYREIYRAMKDLVENPLDFLDPLYEKGSFS